MGRNRPPTPKTLADFKIETLRGAAGFVRVAQARNGQWWFIGLDDRPFFSCGVDGVQLGADEVAAPTEERLRRWRINTLGPRSAPELFERDFYYTRQLDFRKAAPEAT